MAITTGPGPVVNADSPNERRRRMDRRTFARRKLPLANGVSPTLRPAGSSLAAMRVRSMPHLSSSSGISASLAR